MTTTAPLAGRAASGADYERLGLSRDAIAPWEDGARTDGGPGSFEWWYFDAHLDDGAALVVVFQDKDFTEPRKPLTPLVRINLDLPDGRSLQKEQGFAGESYSAATEHADVRIAGNRFECDLQRYRIGDEVHETAGIGYHDHNWGNAALQKLIHDWYWARGQAGPYSVLTSYVTAHERYGYATIPNFMLARDGHILTSDAEKVAFTVEDVHTDEKTGKPVANVLRYSYSGGDDRYVVTYAAKDVLTRARLIEGIHGVKRLAATLAGFDGAYLRFSGECRVQCLRAGALVEEFADKAIWELMYFGHAR